MLRFVGESLLSLGNRLLPAPGRKGPRQKRKGQKRIGKKRKEKERHLLLLHGHEKKRKERKRKTYLGDGCLRKEKKRTNFQEQNQHRLGAAPLSNAGCSKAMLMSSGTVGIAPSTAESLRDSAPKQC